LLEPEVCVLLDVFQQIIIALEVIAESIIIPRVLAVFHTVFFAQVGTGFINPAFIVRGQEIATGMDHDVPLVAIDIDRHLIVSQFP
tara:strand:- start:393 stop:650 length:258 start_codon:yes stop_codon:yes gene_type:complete